MPLIGNCTATSMTLTPTIRPLKSASRALNTTSRPQTATTRALQAIIRSPAGHYTLVAWHKRQLAGQPCASMRLCGTQVVATVLIVVHRALLLALACPNSGLQCSSSAQRHCLVAAASARIVRHVCASRHAIPNDMHHNPGRAA